MRVLADDVEGPFVFKLNGKELWALIVDYFGGNQSKWGIATSTDWRNWDFVTRRNWPYYTPAAYFPPGMRHGSVISVSAKEIKTILDAFGSTRIPPPDPPSVQN